MTVNRRDLLSASALLLAGPLSLRLASTRTPAQRAPRATLPPYDSWCRITIGTEPEVDAFLQALRASVHG
jgi:hypothetical protein